MATKKPPTPRDKLAAKQGAVLEPKSKELTEPKGKAVATTKAERELSNAEYRSRYFDSVAPSGIVGRLVKFNKDGEFVTTDDGEEVPEGSEFAALCGETLLGYLRFNGADEAPSREMGPIYDGYRIPSPSHLPDRDQRHWDVNPKDGTPIDPWQEYAYLVLQETSTCELHTFSTASKTGYRAVIRLLQHYDRMLKTHPGDVPIVRLGTGGFQHRDKSIGWVKTPVFVVCGRREADSFAKPDTSVSSFLNDEIPTFEEN
jgi:hypothetical protein